MCDDIWDESKDVPLEGEIAQKRMKNLGYSEAWLEDDLEGNNVDAEDMIDENAMLEYEIDQEELAAFLDGIKEVLEIEAKRQQN